MKENWIKSFIKSAGAILLVSALGRFLVAAGNASFLSLPDPALGIPLRYAVLAVGAIELLVALICLFGRKMGLQTGWLAWFATNWVVFQGGLFWMHCHPQATGIGSLTDPLRLSRGMPGIITGLLPFYLLLGSYGAVLWLWLERRRAKDANDLKMSCPACGVHIRFDVRNIGWEIPCPHCQAAIALRLPGGSMKMTCVLCGGRIEFPAHSVGQKIHCPHCAKNITLLNPA